MSLVSTPRPGLLRLRMLSYGRQLVQNALSWLGSHPDHLWPEGGLWNGEVSGWDSWLWADAAGGWLQVGTFLFLWGAMIGEKCRMWGQRQKGRGRKLCDKFGLLVAQPPLPGHYLYPTETWGSSISERRWGEHLLQACREWSQVSEGFWVSVLKTPKTFVPQTHHWSLLWLWASCLISLNFRDLHCKVWISAPALPLRL